MLRHFQIHLISYFKELFKFEEIIALNLIIKGDEI